MSADTPLNKDRKIVLVTRRTRLDDLLARHHTLSQARFYLEHLGADFSDYLKENAAYAHSLQQCVAALQDWGRYQIVERHYLPNFVFGETDIVVALGQDGLVANTLKYLDHGQPLIGVNPEPQRWDGVLLPFLPGELARVLGDVASERRPTRAVTMAEARLSDGQTLRAVNDLFIGPRTHTSALYDIELGGQRESQSSSGLIVSTGLGSSAWLKSVVTGSLGVARALAGAVDHEPAPYQPLPWDTDRLTFVVREPFPSRSSRAELVYGNVTAPQTLTLRSRMPDHGVIFSDGMEADYLRFTAGMEARIGVAPVQGCLAL
jgi:NAD kinase